MTAGPTIYSAPPPVPLHIESRPVTVAAVRLPPDLAQQIEAVATARNATQSAVLRALIRAGLEQLHARDRSTQPPATA